MIQPDPLCAAPGISGKSVDPSSSVKRDSSSSLVRSWADFLDSVDWTE